MSQPLPPLSHRWYEDMLAILTGTLCVAFGVLLYAQARILVGGTTGLALLVHYASGWSFGMLYWLLNLPFYGLGWRKMGLAFVIRTAAAVSLVSLFTTFLPRWVTLSAVEPLFAALFGGVLMGLGLLVLFRHRTGLGGVNILALYLQEHYGWRAGYVQLGLDLAILAGGIWVLPREALVFSVIGAVVVNLGLAINHRPGRYLGMS